MLRSDPNYDLVVKYVKEWLSENSYTLDTLDFTEDSIKISMSYNELRCKTSNEITVDKTYPHRSTIHTFMLLDGYDLVVNYIRPIRSFDELNGLE